MQLQFFCPRWGNEHIDWDAFFQKVKAAGYDGVEWAIEADTPVQLIEKAIVLAFKHNLLMIAQHYDTNYIIFEKHQLAYRQWLRKVQPFPWVKINSQTGRDFFSLEQNKQLIECAAEYAAVTGMDIVHETHRGKFSYAAHATMPYLLNDPRLQLTFDLSHWVCVSESYLDGQEAALHLAIERTAHIHARVGYPEGPQVPDPRIPEAATALDFHLQCWRRVAAAHKQAGHSMLTITPEFGPHPYMVHVPATGEPVASQWDINVFMMNLLKQQL